MQIERPYRQLLNIFIVFFLIISGYLVYWQMARASDVQASVYNPRNCTQDNVPQRGTIFDRNGVKLAWSDPDKNAPCGWVRHYADTTLAPIIGYYDPTEFGVTGIEAAYNNTLSGNQTPDNVDFQTGWQNLINKAEHLKTFGNDIYLTIDDKMQQIASQQYNSQANRHCGTTLLSSSILGSVVVEDPHTGEILAAVSNPGYDADKLVNHSRAPDKAVDQNGIPLSVGEEYFKQLQKDPSSPLINRISSNFEIPGSVFKTLTLIAALDTGKYSLQSTFSQADASTYTVDGNTINSNNLDLYNQGPKPPTFPLTIKDAYAYSDNVVFARLGVSLGTDVMTSYGQKFGISFGNTLASLPFDLPLIKSWMYKPGNNFDAVALANTGFGQGYLQISPLVMTVMTSAIAADGKEYAPHLLLKSVANGTDPKTVPNATPQLLGQVMTPQTAQSVREAMSAVVNYGSVGASGTTFRNAINPPLLEGGKTGTGQDDAPDTQNPQLASYPQAWFISVAPDDVNNPTGNPPRLAMVVQRHRGGEGSCQAPYAQAIYNQLLPMVGH
jgi:penicillin-binding protein A